LRGASGFPFSLFNQCSLTTEYPTSKKRALYGGGRIGIYPGQYYDSETGLHYNYYRYYDPQAGRYLTPDPIGLLGGENLFEYSLNNAVNVTDPLGLVPCVGGALLECQEICAGQDASVRHCEQTCVGGVWGDLITCICDEECRPGEHRHHLLPRELKKYFEAAGLNIELFVECLPGDRHLQKSGRGTHTNQPGSENWNAQWRQFRRQNPAATRDEIIIQLRKMLMERLQTRGF